MSFRLALIPLSLCLSGVASAATGLAWQWEEGQTRRYFLQAQVQLADPLTLYAENNGQVRISEIQLSLDTACTAVAAVGKRSHELHCKISDFAARARPYKPEAGRLKPILDEIDAKLTAPEAFVQLVVTDDGRVRSVDLEGVDKRNERAQQTFEVTRLLLARAYAALDLELPKKGDDKGEGAWRQTANLIAQVPSTQGSMGAIELVHTIKSSSESLHDLESVGRGTMGGGEMITINGAERPKDLYDMQIGGNATFDAGKGMLLTREYLVEGVPTASSVSAEYGGVPYVQAVRLRYVPEGHELKPFGDNQELEPVDRPTLAP